MSTVTTTQDTPGKQMASLQPFTGGVVAGAVQTDVVGLFAFMYVLVAAGFAGDLLSCDARRLLASSLVVKHVVLLTACVVVAGQFFAGQSFGGALAKAVGVYVLFVISTKSQAWLLTPLLLLVLADQLVRLWQQTADKKQPGLDRVRFCLQASCAALVVGGFLGYFAKQLHDRGADFDVGKFLLGTLQCEGGVKLPP